MRIAIEEIGGAEDGLVTARELQDGDVLAWHTGPKPVKETDPPEIVFQRVGDVLHVQVRMR